MSVVTSLQKDIAPLTASDIDEIRRLRLAKGWTYQQLADDISKLTEVKFTAVTIRRVLESEVEPREITLYNIRLWLSARRRAEAGR
jgi:transcriptional regulator with XRE-family HTH domain